MALRGIRGKRAGLTLVELVIAMLILGAVGGAATEALVMVLRADREAGGQAQDLQILAELTDILGRDAANLVAGEAGGVAPFSEGIDTQTGERVWRLLVRAPEGWVGESEAGEAQAVAASYRLRELRDGGFELLLTRQAAGPAGLVDENKRESVLVERIERFSITAIYNQQDQSGAGGPETGEDTGGTAQVPKALEASFWLKAESEGGRGQSVTLPVYARAAEQENED